MADPGFAKEGQTMASVKHKPIMEVSPQWGPGAESLLAAKGRRQNPLKLKVFCPFSYKRRAKSLGFK